MTTKARRPDQFTAIGNKAGFDALSREIGAKFDALRHEIHAKLSPVVESKWLGASAGDAFDEALAATADEDVPELPTVLAEVKA